MVNQTLIAAGMISVCEGLLYAWRAGLDLETVMERWPAGRPEAGRCRTWAPA